MSSKKRCVFGCDDLGAYMHRFPHPEKRKELFSLWLATVGDRIVEKDPKKIYNSKRVCDYHFKPEQKVTGHRLINFAVPTLHLQSVVKDIAIDIQIEHNYSLPRMNMDVNVNFSTPQTDEPLVNNSELSINEHSLNNETPCMDNDDWPSTSLEEGNIQEGNGTASNKWKTLKHVYSRNKLHKHPAKLKVKQKDFNSRLSKVKRIVKKVSVPGQVITEKQFKQAYKKGKGCRFSIEQEILFLLIYKKSPKSYRHLAKLFSLPSPKSLKNIQRRLNINTDINEIEFEKLKETADKLFVEYKLVDKHLYLMKCL